MARIAARGRRRPIARGEVLVEGGEHDVPFFVVVSGEVQALRPTGATEILIVAHGPGQFSGEAIMITGRRAMGRLRVSEPGEVIQLEREQLLALIQTDAELSEILMRSFMLRRLELIAHEFGDVVMLGSTHCSGTLRVKEFLTRNGHPFHYIDLDRDADAQALLDQFQVSAADVPVLICGAVAVLRNPSRRGSDEGQSRTPPDAIRGLIEAILLEPDGDRLKITLKGGVVGMLSAASDSNRSQHG